MSSQEILRLVAFDHAGLAIALDEPSSEVEFQQRKRQFNLDAKDGDLDAMKRAFDACDAAHQGPLVNATDFLGCTALLHASTFNHIEAVAWLLSKGARIDEPDIGDGIALSKAAWFSNNEVLKYLIDAGGDDQKRDAYGNTAYLYQHFPDTDIAGTCSGVPTDWPTKERNRPRTVELLWREAMSWEDIEKLLMADDLAALYEAGFQGNEALLDDPYPRHGAIRAKMDANHLVGIVGKRCHPCDRLRLYDQTRKVPDASWVHPVVCQERLTILVERALLPIIKSAGECQLDKKLKHFFNYLLHCHVDINGIHRKQIMDATNSSMKKLEEILEHEYAQYSVLPRLHFTSKGEISLNAKDAAVDMRREGWKILHQSKVHDNLAWLDDQDIFGCYQEFKRLGECAGPSEFIVMVYEMKGLALLQGFQEIDPASSDRFWAKIYARWMVAVAKHVNDAFIEAMNGLYAGKFKFKPAPLKKMSRIISKTMADLEEEKSIPQAPPAEDLKLPAELAALLAADLKLIMAYGGICDIVRGAVMVETEAEAEEAVQLLIHSELEVVRMKNTNHPMAKTVGHYRDIKLLVIIENPKSNCKQICELQILMRRFDDIKQLMHPLYKILRGDF